MSRRWTWPERHPMLWMLVGALVVIIAAELISLALGDGIQLVGPLLVIVVVGIAGLARLRKIRNF